MIKTAILTMSDKRFRGERIDGTGPVIRGELEDQEYVISFYKMIPDEIGKIEKELIEKYVPGIGEVSERARS